jgi:phosphoribosylformylglycinamidine synthase I
VKISVIVFPGSNCDHDVYHAFKKLLGADAEFVWHKESDLGNTDLIVLPGGFSYGDYLRSGAIARFSPVMKEVIRRAGTGMPVLGICNGFQILTESGLLPGALMRNRDRRFICEDVHLRVENNETLFTSRTQPGQILRIPIAHGEGNYYCDSETRKELEDNRQIIFRYSDSNGNISEEANPNGSISNIAGIANRAGNVLGMMPHPERNAESLLGNSDGTYILGSIIDNLMETVSHA